MKKDGDHTYTLTLTVRNRPGVLVRCAQVFNRRGHNIESLYVRPAIDAHTSTMVITAFGKKAMMDQVVAQLSKLIDVVSITEQEAPEPTRGSIARLTTLAVKGATDIL